MRHDQWLPFVRKVVAHPAKHSAEYAAAFPLLHNGCCRVPAHRTNANSTTTPIDATTTTTATNKNTTTTTNTMPTTTPTVNTTATNIKNTIINTKNTITNTNTNTNSKPIIAMRPSDDLQPGHEEDQQGSSTTPANG